MIIFEPYKNKTLSQDDKNFITAIFSQLNDPYSYQSSLQLLYNNSLHFSSNLPSINSLQQLNSLHEISIHPTIHIVVQGNIHYNYHPSNLLLNANKMTPLFVKDSYIRFYIKDSLNPSNSTSILHLLVYSPEIQSSDPYFFHPNHFYPPMIISPTYL